MPNFNRRLLVVAAMGALALAGCSKGGGAGAADTADMTLQRRTLLGAAGLAALPPLAAQAQTRWQVASAYPDGNFHTKNLREFIDKLMEGGYTVADKHTPDPDLIAPDGKVARQFLGPVDARVIEQAIVAAGGEVQ